ncbi:MAG: hypothetical protein N2446_01930 [Elusimicrobiales bacterium]|nr:hypothetical protein [Elusimicrobiales bacterium]
MKKYKNMTGVVINEDYACGCCVTNINLNEITFISDLAFKKGDKIKIQLSEKNNNLKRNFFISAIVKKDSQNLSGNGNLNFAMVC